VSAEPLDPQTVTCAQIEDRGLLADYVAGVLPEADWDAVEAHVIGCGRCAGALEAILAARDVLAEPAARGADAASSTPTRLFAVALLAAAAIVAAIVLVPRRTAERAITPDVAPASSTARTTISTVAPAVLALARVDPPAYAPFPVRSADEQAARFHDAMDAYVQRDFARAADRLRAVVAADSTNVQARFYLGVSLVMTDDARGAADAFRAVAAAGPSPFHDSARLLLAKAEMRAGDLDAAARTLADASRESGPHAAEAAELARQLDAARTRRRH
jgi:TolA-binding protein